MGVMTAWDAAFERACHRLVEEVCGGASAVARDRAWQALLTRVAGHVERWAATSPSLRRVGLTGEDEPRAVLVDVIDRLCHRDFANLRAYLARQAPDADEQAETDLVLGLARLAEPTAPDDAPATGDVVHGTPLRGWLLTLTRFVIKEHIKQRFGWHGLARWVVRLDPPARCPPGWSTALVADLRARPGVVEVELLDGGAGLAIGHRPSQIRAAELERMVVERGASVRSLPAPPGKRGVGSGAERLDVAPEPGERPPLSTLLGLRRALTEIHAFLAGFPPPMQRALHLWLAEAGFDAIAADLALPGPRDAQALVRAGQARLRERFRGAWPELFG